MRPHQPLFEWQILENQEGRGQVAWQPLLEATPSTQVDPRPPLRQRRYLLGGVLALLLLLTGAGGWLWHKANAGLQQVEGELHGTVQLELAAAALVPTQPEIGQATPQIEMVWQRQLHREQEMLQGDTSAELVDAELVENQLDSSVHTINLQDDLVVAEFILPGKEEGQAYRQSRFYRNTAEGWQRIKPVAALWGTPRHLESVHFIFSYRHNDAAAVAAVAPQLDALYTKLQQSLGLPVTPDKLVIEVTVERVTGATAIPRWERERLVVPSPALYLAPVALSDATLLAQSIAIPLIEFMVTQALEGHAIPVRWQPLLLGIKLWQLWELEMPLARWRHDIVHWLYFDLPASDLERQTALLPASYAEFCAMHSLWMLWPTYVGIPLNCTTLELTIWSDRRWLDPLPHMPLQQLHLPPIGYEPYYDSHLYRSHETVKTATLIEYIVASYGEEHLPVLFKAMTQHESWDTLIPALYGLSTADFEQGWQAYLVDEYALQPNLLRR